MTTVRDLLQLDSNSVNHMPREEVERIQLQILDQQFQKLKYKIKALSTLAEIEGITKIETFEDVARLAFPDKLFKSYDPQILIDENWSALTKWLQRFVPTDLSDVNHSDVTSLQGWIDKMLEHGIVILMSSGTLGSPSFYPRTLADIELWEEGTRWMISDALPGVVKEEDLAVVFPSFKSGSQVALYMNGKIAATLAGQGKFHCLYDASLPADVLTLMSKFAHAKSTGNQEAIAEMMPVLQKMQIQREQGANAAQQFMAGILNQYMGKDQAVFLAGGAPDVVKMAQALISQGITGAFQKFYCLTGGGFKGEDAPENWQETISQAFGPGPVVLLSGKTETAVYDIEVGQGKYLARVFNAAGVISEDGEYLPREGTQTGLVFNGDLCRTDTWGVTQMRDLVALEYGNVVLTGIPSRSAIAQGMSCSKVAGTVEDIILEINANQ